MLNPRAHSAPAAIRDARARSRSEPRSALRRLAAALTTLVLGAGLAIAGAVAPASAHHNTISGVGVCHADSSTFDITWTVVNSEDKTEEVVVSSNESLVPVGTGLGKKGTATFTDYGVEAGTHELTLTTEWSNGLRSSDTGSVTVSGDCGDGAVQKVTFCHATGSASNPYVRLTTSVRAFYHAGHIGHQDGRDIYPEFSYVVKGETYAVPAQGDQALLQFEDCSASTVPAAPVLAPAVPAESELPATPGIPEEPSLAGSTVSAVCRADAPWIVFDIVLTDPDGTATDGTASLVFSDGEHTETIELGALDENGVLEGKVLWPGASVADDGVTPIGWPGWEQVDGEWVETEGNFAWTRDVTSALLVVNPDLEVAITYPVATPDCIAAPPQDVDPSGAVNAAFGTGLASTGFAGTTIAIVAGVVVIAGVAFLVIARMRRNRG